MAKKLLNVAAWINLVIGGVVLLFSLLIANISWFIIIGALGIITGAVRCAIGAVFLTTAKKNGEEFVKRRGYILAASIVSLLTCHIVTFILGIIAYCNMYKNVPLEQSKKREFTEEEKAERRLKNLLALGCALVLLAGVIFAMTTWSTLDGIGKMIALIIATVIFFGMSYFSENKFGLKASSVTYYILAEAFCVFSFIAAGYFNIFGDWFSLNGEGAALYKACLFVLAAGLLYFSYLKYNKVDIFYLFDIALIMSGVSVLDFFNAGNDIVLFSLIFIFGILALISTENDILKRTVNLGKFFLPLTSFIFIMYVITGKTDDRIIFYLMSFGVIFISSYYLAIFNKNVFYEILAPIFTLGAAFSLSAAFETNSNIIFLQLLLIGIVVYAIGYYKRDIRSLFTSTAIVCDLGFLYVLADSLNLGYNYFAVIAGLILLGTSILVLASKKFGKYYFEVLIEPIKVILLSYAVYKLIYTFEYMENGLFFGLISIIFASICIFRKDFMKKIYFISAILTTTLTLLINVFEYAPICYGLVIISFIILIIMTFKVEDSIFVSTKEVIYGLLLASVSVTGINIFSNFNLRLIGIALIALIYLVLFIAFNKNDMFRRFTVVAMLIPYIISLPISVFNENVNYILYSLPWLALIFVYSRGFLSSINLKFVNLIEIITLSIWYLVVTSQVNLEVAIFIGIISFIAILIGYRNDKWESLYYTGVAFLILNTLVQLKEFWTSIPIWAYIFVAGLALIGLVTYKEYARANKKNEIEKVEVEVVNKAENIVVKENIDTRTILAGSILYLVFIPIFLEIII